MMFEAVLKAQLLHSAEPFSLKGSHLRHAMALVRAPLRV
jgi:hypothetical protein